ncbi:hypothetical protein H6501_03140 [Candidatus Woesearchaeota archaeon]|nr:hypothetical protein [Candidatus Woesearchaeota archaeon]USN43648.1 MAG: hypothetical protein H6500_04625 [Candidatus Woesearchaeota archaeon]
MSAKKRDKLEVIHDILQIIKQNGNQIKPTPLLRFSNLSSQSFALYEEELLEKKLMLVQMENKKKFYKITEKGHRYLDQYQMIRTFMQDFDL